MLKHGKICISWIFHYISLIKQFNFIFKKSSFQCLYASYLSYNVNLQHVQHVKPHKKLDTLYFLLHISDITLEFYF